MQVRILTMKESLSKQKLWYHFIKTWNYISHLYLNFWQVTVLFQNVINTAKVHKNRDEMFKITN